MLIHPIQWTIALPVGMTGPAKRQKKTSTSRTGQESAFARWRAWRVKTCFHDKQIFYSTANTSICFQHLTNSAVLSTTMSSPGQRRGSCGHAMAGLTPTPSVHVVEIRGWVTTLASSRKNVMSARGLPLNRSINYQPPPTEIEKRRRRLRPPLLPLSWTLHT